MAKTDNLGLHLSGTTEEDLSQTFRDWRLQMSGENSDSNMQIIDRAYKQTESEIQNVRSEMDSLTAEDVGARADTWLPTPDQIGAMPSSVVGGVSGNLVYLNESGSLSDSGVSSSTLTTLADTTKTKMQLSGTVLYITTL